MLLIAVDTSGKRGSIALARGNSDGSCDLIETVALEGGTFSAQLVPQIAALLAKHNSTKQDVAGFAVASGPGSFTGLRVGLAAIKALAEVLLKPIAAVSPLEAVAVSGHTQGRVIAALDAGRNEVYAGEYEMAGDTATLVSERLISRAELQSVAKGRPVLTPDSTVAELAQAMGLDARVIDCPGSKAIARIGWRRILAGDTTSPETLEANYIRRSDAEIFSKPST